MQSRLLGGSLYKNHFIHSQSFLVCNVKTLREEQYFLLFRKPYYAQWYRLVSIYFPSSPSTMTITPLLMYQIKSFSPFAENNSNGCNGRSIATVVCLINPIFNYSSSLSFLLEASQGDEAKLNIQLQIKSKETKKPECVIRFSTLLRQSICSGTYFIIWHVDQIHVFV